MSLQSFHCGVYRAFAEAREIPVGIHVSGGGPAEPYTGSPAFRARLQSALTLEEVLAVTRSCDYM